jgi:hypothetical protein
MKVPIIAGHSSSPGTPLKMGLCMLGLLGFDFFSSIPNWNSQRILAPYIIEFNECKFLAPEELSW